VIPAEDYDARLGWVCWRDDGPCNYRCLGKDSGRCRHKSECLLDQLVRAIDEDKRREKDERRQHQ